MSNFLTRTVRILKPARVRTDDRGRTVWDGPVEETELELVSTTMLRAMLDSGDAEHKKRLRAAANSKDGVLARNPSSGSFEIIDDDDLKAALAHAEKEAPDAGRAADVTWEPVQNRADTGDEELSLVSTHALRRMLGQPEEKKATPQSTGKRDKSPGGGFDPYNSA